MTFAALVPYTEAVQRYDPVIGLETHVELGTRSKMFCGCATTFGASPNTQICPVCLGLPGSLPVANRAAVEATIRIGLALHCSIASWCRFARKNYFYPDMPKDFQISQYDEPLCVDGWLDVAVEDDVFRVGIERVHLEEDTGKTVHVGGATGRIHGADYSLVDYNRAGIPLVEIVTKPVDGTRDLAPEAARRLRHRAPRHRARPRCLRRSGWKRGRCAATATCPCHVVARMCGALGRRRRTSTRCARWSARSGTRSPARPVCSMRERVIQETRHWHEDTGQTTPGRSKEQAEDYRYFPELVPRTER